MGTPKAETGGSLPFRRPFPVGSGPGELHGLLPQDYQKGRLLIRRAVNSYGEETKGKNENAIRPITLSPLARACVDAQLADLPDDVPFLAFLRWMFIAIAGKPIARQTRSLTSPRMNCAIPLFPS